MTITTQYGNYVKFLRGTPTAYANLTPKDSDTLYFISETNADRGVLYLGEKLISGSLSSSTTLEDLSDVLIGAGIQAGSLLYYDGSKWVNKTLSEIFEIIVSVMVGATPTTNGRSGLVPTPARGQQNLYLKGDATWGNPTATIEPTINLMVTQVGTLIGNDTDMSVREIAQQEVGKIVDNAPAAFDTLKEIAEYLADHPSEGDIAARLTAIESVILTPTTGLQDRMGLAETAINTIQNTMNSFSLADAEHDRQIADIYDKLKWQDMIINN